MKIQALITDDKKVGLQTYGRLPYAFVRGAGARLWDIEDNEYLDFLGGIAVVPLGHCHSKVTAAIQEQAATLIHTSNLYYIEPQVRLAERLYEISGGMRAFFCNSGAEANEAALKIARKHIKEKLGEERFEIITATASFHGRTYTALAATGQPKYHKGFEPMPPGFLHVPLNDIEALRKLVNEKTAAIMLEPTQGETGINPCTPEYLQAVRALCDEHGLVLIFDEIQSGMGRSGKFFAHEWAGVRGDIVTLAKGLANGVPIGALLASEEVATAFSPGTHGSTFGGNFLSSSAALATLSVLFDEDLMENATQVGDYFSGRLKDWAQNVGILKEVRGRGLMIGVELSQPIARDLMEKSLECGLIFNAVGETVLRFLPPLNISTDDVDEAMDKLEAARTSLD